MKEISVLYDYMGFSQKVGGVSRCFYELINHLPDNISTNIGIKQSYNLYLNNSTFALNLDKNPLTADNFLSSMKIPGRRTLFSFIEKYIPFFPSYNNINKNYVISLLKEGKFDVFHPTGTDDYFLPYIGNKPFVFTVHDMIWELYNVSPELQKTRAKLVKRASHIIAISESTKKDLIDILNIPEEKITVIYHGGPNVIAAPQSRIIVEPYFLFVGRRHTYKNFIQTIKDFSAFSKNNPEVHLVCTGNPLNKFERELINQLGIKDKVRSLYVSDEELANLYSHSIGFIFPSLYEGFGLPILESFAYGCPVILNNASCFPEIASDAAIYFESKDGDSNLSDVMNTVYKYTDDQRLRIIQMGYNRLNCFSWEHAALQLAQIYEKVNSK